MFVRYKKQLAQSSLDPKKEKQRNNRSLTYTLYICPQKVVHQTHGDNFVNFNDFQNFFTGRNRTKFETKLCNISQYVAALPCEIWKFDVNQTSVKVSLQQCQQCDDKHLIKWM